MLRLESIGVLWAGILMVIFFYWYGKSAFDEALVEGAPN